MKQTKPSYPQFTPTQIHKLLIDKRLSEEYKANEVTQPGFLCPYYVPLTGALGTDWGVIVNPQSPKFGQLVFEHDGCGCANHQNQFGNQDGTSWIAHPHARNTNGKETD